MRKSFFCYNISTVNKIIPFVPLGCREMEEEDGNPLVVELESKDVKAKRNMDMWFSKVVCSLTQHFLILHYFCAINTTVDCYRMFSTT